LKREKQTQPLVSDVPPVAGPIPTPLSGIRKVRAAKGYVLPISYLGSIIMIDEKNTREIDVAQLKYEPKLQFEKALLDKHLIEVGD
jgi:hypothetical protein